MFRQLLVVTVPAALVTVYLFAMFGFLEHP
jgi:hypothetical protein